MDMSAPSLYMVNMWLASRTVVGATETIPSKDVVVTLPLAWLSQFHQQLCLGNCPQGLK